MPGVEDFVKLFDFGIAKLSSESNQHLTTTGTMLGSPAFMAPEQVRSNDVDHRVDLHAVGATTSFEPHSKFDACMVGALRQVKWPASKTGGAPHVNFTARTRDNP